MTALSAVRIEGGLFAPDLFDALAAAELTGQRPADFGLTARGSVTDEVAALFADAREYWHAFEKRLDRLPETDLATTATRDGWMIPFLSLFGYDLRYNSRAFEIDGLSFAISHSAGEGDDAPPVHIVGIRQELGRVPASGRPRLAPHSLVQEYLNRTEHLWGIATNGAVLRLLRNSTFIRRQAYVEFDLRAILADQRFPDFMALYRLLHRSRFAKRADGKSLLESYYQHSVEQGGRVREHLRDGVKTCIEHLAAGFLSHRANDALRTRVALGSAAADPISPEALYREILTLIYRFLFLLVAEDRGLVSDDPLYREHYGIARLRRLVDHRAAFDEQDDIWQSLRVLWRLLKDEDLARTLHVAALDGALFEPLDLDRATIANRELLTAFWHLAYYEPPAAPPRRVNYAALDVEELGSIYESLLDFHPAIESSAAGAPRFALLAGSERKTTGSYYTPPELVAELIKSALEPVLAARLKAVPPERRAEALLSLKICDPACGSGHFLLAAARRMGKELARLKTGEAEPAPERVREAIREVIGHSIYGVDKNPLAVDLCRVALWLESHTGKNPLSFLDRRIRCGDSLIGVFDLEALKNGIPDAAFKPLTGDDHPTARALARRNKAERTERQLSLPWDPAASTASLALKTAEIDRIADDTPALVAQKRQLFEARERNPEWARERDAANLWTAAFFQAFRPNASPITSDAVLDRLANRPVAAQVQGNADALAHEGRFFHWPLEFPEVFASGGFDVVLGNPPWERIKLQEQEFFAVRDAAIANAPNKAARGKLIAALKAASEGGRERALSDAFERAKKHAEAESLFAHDAGRFPLTGRGDINTYALFAELFSLLVSPHGRAGAIVPLGIATSDTLSTFFSNVTQTHRLSSLYSLSEIKRWFPASKDNQSFCLLTFGMSDSPEFAFRLDSPTDLDDARRRFTLSATDLSNLNPNTRTAPVFRSRADADLTAKIYSRVPVLIDEAKGAAGNPWGISFATMFHMSNDSGLFRTAAQLHDAGFVRDGTDWLKGAARYVPLYEAKMIHQFDHRFGFYPSNRVEDTRALPRPTLEQKRDPAFEPAPRYWVPEPEVASRLAAKNWARDWLMGWRDITNATNERTVIATAFPRAGVGNKIPLMLPHDGGARGIAALIADLSSLTLDYAARQKVGGMTLNFFIYQQLPILPPTAYTSSDLAFIVPRVIKLSYTSFAMAPFARDLGYDGPPFAWNEDRRAHLRAELDAFYARAYDLTRDELRYVLDPQDALGADYPSETFRVLKKNEIAKFGEYRTARLVLSAFDAQSTKKEAAE